MAHSAEIIYRWVLDTLTIAYTLHHKASPDDADGVADAVQADLMEILQSAMGGRSADVPVSDDDLRSIFAVVLTRAAGIAGMPLVGRATNDRQ